MTDDEVENEYKNDNEYDEPMVVPNQVWRDEETFGYHRITRLNMPGFADWDGGAPSVSVQNVLPADVENRPAYNLGERYSYIYESYEDVLDFYHSDRFTLIAHSSNPLTEGHVKVTEENKKLRLPHRTRKDNGGSKEEQ